MPVKAVIFDAFGTLLRIRKRPAKSPSEFRH